MLTVRLVRYLCESRANSGDDDDVVVVLGEDGSLPAGDGVGDLGDALSDGRHNFLVWAVGNVGLNEKELLTASDVFTWEESS